jgi:hypothetical protein
MNTRAYAVLEARKALVPFEFDRREVGAHDVALECICVRQLSSNALTACTAARTIVSPLRQRRLAPRTPRASSFLERFA